METKTLSVITKISMTLTFTAAALSIIGVAITGFYPGIIVLSLLVLIPVGSRFYTKKAIRESSAFEGKYFTTLTIINVLTILVVIWMAFVILVDRVFSNIL
jgi:hypothetical protein